MACSLVASDTAGRQVYGHTQNQSTRGAQLDLMLPRSGLLPQGSVFLLPFKINPVSGVFRISNNTFPLITAGKTQGAAHKLFPGTGFGVIDVRFMGLHCSQISIRNREGPSFLPTAARRRKPPSSF